MNEMSDMELIAKALIVAEKKLIEQERRLAEMAETIVAQEEQIQAMAPKADFFDELVEQNLLMSIRQTAKELDIRKNDFVSFLLDDITPKGREAFRLLVKLCANA